jgi:hypothetical protein
MGVAPEFGIPNPSGGAFPCLKSGRKSPPYFSQFVVLTMGSIIPLAKVKRIMEGCDMNRSKHVNLKNSNA